MSVVLKGVDIPRSCIECPCVLNLFFCGACGGRTIIDSKSAVKIQDNNSIHVSRPEWCPMEELEGFSTCYEELNMKVESKRLDDVTVKFEHYKVHKKGDHYYAITDNSGIEITAGETMGQACKKAKLLEIGYQQAMAIYME